MSRQGAAVTFWALSDPVRLEILDHIADGTATTVTRLAASMPITRQAVTRHVQTLSEAGLVTGHKDGREQHYTVTRAPLDEAAGWLTSRAAAWDRTLERLASYVEQETD